ncbi:MAG: FkbM family methyltransferase [Candidatus Gracilibacteria bacterium]
MSHRTKQISVGKYTYNILFRDSTDESVIEEVLIDQDYKICKKLIKEASDCIIDIGAHIGTFEFFVRSLNHSVPIIAYEAAVDNFELLTQNIKQNALQKITAFHMAAAGTTEDVYLNISNNNHNNSLCEPYAKDAKQYKIVPGISLDDIMKENNIEICSLLKIDCEGAEYDIFESTSPETFSKIQAIFMEYHEHFGRSHKELIEIFEKNGFTIRHLKPSKYSKTLGIMLAVK